MTNLTDRSILMVVSISFIAGLVGSIIGMHYYPEIIGEQGDVKGQSELKVIDENSAIVDLVEDTQDSVVSIIVSVDVPVYEDYSYSPFDVFGNGFFHFPTQRKRVQVGEEEREIGAGTGFIVSDDGLIVTNKHVVDDADAYYTVILNDGQQFDAKVLDRDQYLDIAILQIDYQPESFIQLGDSSSLKVGQRVVAIGNSLGEFSNTVSAGIISGLSRSITAGSGYLGEYENLDDVIQTDAAVNEGNSGGPLLDINGNAIGVNVAVASGAENIGFAIPINNIKTIVDSVQEYGKIVRPFLGVRYLTVDESVQDYYELGVNYGALLIKGSNGEAAVVVDGPADKAGLVEGDVILSLDGDKLDQETTLQQLIQKHSIGDVVQLEIWRDGKKKTIKVELGSNE